MDGFCTVAISDVCCHQDAMTGVWNWLLLSGISRVRIWHSYAENRTDGC